MVIFQKGGRNKKRPVLDSALSVLVHFERVVEQRNSNWNPLLAQGVLVIHRRGSDLTYGLSDVILWITINRQGHMPNATSSDFSRRKETLGRLLHSMLTLEGAAGVVYSPEIVSNLQKASNGYENKPGANKGLHDWSGSGEHCEFCRLEHLNTCECGGLLRATLVGDETVQKCEACGRITQD